MNTRQTARRSIQANPFAQVVERMAGLARYWETDKDGRGNTTATLKHSLEESRLILNEVIEREYEIAAKTQRQLADRIISLAAARSPEAALACQFDILALVANASAEHSAAWADCCRSIRERCVLAAAGGTEGDDPSAHQCSRVAAIEG